MARVHVLPPAIASQIAAGEVVERPASAAKELIENALDAQATRCDVSCEGGGVTLLSVRDDGVGMSEEDALRAIERHATSKLAQLADLNHLLTFGFRGEALPTIASVSRFALRTRARGSDHGCCVEIDCGKAPVVRREGLPVGTTVTVRDLFVNVPARRKFLRSTGTESAHVTAALEGAALARHDVTFTLERDGRKMRELLRVATRRERVLQLLPEETLAEIRGERGPLRFEAHLSRPERARPGATGLWLLVNGRFVRDRLLAATIAQAYGGALSPGNYPRGVVYVDLPSELVDVNVHPQKTEVRFVDARALADAVYAIVARGVTTEFSLDPASRGARYAHPSRAHERSPLGILPVERGGMPRQARDGSPQRHAGAAELMRTAVIPPLPAPLPRDLGTGPRLPEVPLPRDLGTGMAAGLQNTGTAREPSVMPATIARAEVAGRTSTMRPPPPFSETEAQAAEDNDEPAPATMVTPPSDPTFDIRAHATNIEASGGLGDRRTTEPLRFLAQVRHSFLVCEGPDGLCIVDQHAASECVTYAKLLAEYRARAVTTQILLFPAMLELSTKELSFVEGELALFRDLGLDVRVRGADRISVHAVPRLLPRATAEQLVRDVIGAVMPKGRSEEAAAERALAPMACHGCLGSGEPLTGAEAQQLLDAFDTVTSRTGCIHQRPIATVLRYADLERQAGRR